MDKKAIRSIKKMKVSSNNYADAINRLKQASMNSRISRKQNKYEDVSTDKLLSSQIITKHNRQASQITSQHMRNIGRILSPSSSNNRSTSMK